MIVRPLQPHDDRSVFSSGAPDFDRFLRSYAAQNQFRHRIGTTLVAVENEVVVGYATFSVGEIRRDELPAASTKRLPAYPLPALRLGRLAVDERFQGVGIGTELVAQVLTIALRLRAELGCVAVVVDALPEARAFYERLGFEAADATRGRTRMPGAVSLVLALTDVDAAREG